MLNTIPSANFSAFTTSLQKIVDLNTATFTNAFAAQETAVKSLLTLSQDRTKAALEIKGIDGWVAFITEQTEIAKSSMQELTENTQVSTKDAEAYFTEVQAILSENQEVVAKAAPALKPAAKK